VARKKGQELDKWEWLDVLASEHGPADPSTRLVLFVLGLHMSQSGERCFPSQKLIAARSALSERSVRVHLDRAEAGGWIGIYRKRRGGQAWFVNEYVASIPKEVAGLVKEKPWIIDPEWVRPAESAARQADTRQNLPPVDEQEADGAGHPADNARHPANGAATGGSLRTDTRQNLPPNSSSNSSSNFPKNTPKERAPHRVFFENKVKSPEQIEAEEREQQEAQERARKAGEAKAVADQAAAEELARKVAEERVNRIKVAVKAFPDYSDSDIAKVAGALPSPGTIAQIQLLRRQA
jgi:hypothetical protein